MAAEQHQGRQRLVERVLLTCAAESTLTPDETKVS